MTSEARRGPRHLSPAPEVDVGAFIAAHGTPYDPENDTYQRDPLVAYERHGKASAMYNAHAYHTKVPPEAIRPYLEHYTSPGDLVLDPFCGSGMTGVACLLAGRNAIMSDLSPAAVHIAYNYCTPVDLNALAREWARIKAEVTDEFRWLYGTTCDRCRGPATIQHTIWSDVLACPRCSADIVLWDVGVVREETQGRLDPPLSGLTSAAGWQPVSTDTAPPKRGRGGDTIPRQAGDVLDQFTCQNCSATLKKTECKYRRSEPVLTCYECDGFCRPKRRERATSEEERRRIDETGREEPPHWIPDTPFQETREMWRGVHRDQEITRVRHFWTPRNLWAVASLWSRASTVEDERLGRALRFVLTSTFGRSSKTTRYLFGKGGNSTLGATLYIGSFTCENNLLKLAGRKWDDVRRGFVEQELIQTGAAALGLECSATELHQVPDAAVDYVFTDPPFGSNIFYADCSLLWEAWLGELMDESEEAVWNKSKTPEEGGKTLEDYQQLMEQSFAEMYRVLKPGRWATVVFSNSDERVWHAIQTAAQKAGFAVAAAGSLDKVQRSFKGVRGEKGEETVITKDVVMNLLKPVAGAAALASEEIADLEEYVREQLHQYLSELAKSPGREPERRRTDALYNYIVSTLLPGRQILGVSPAFVQTVAQDSFKQVDGLWYRRGDRVRSERLLTHIADETSAIAWLDRRLGAGPAAEGEIIPEFNRDSAGTHIQGGLTRLLQENFVFDAATRRWRAATALERDALNDAGLEQRRRRVRRVARSGGEDLTAAELLEMAEDAARLELHAEAGEIVKLIHAPDLSAAERERFAMAKAVIEAYIMDGE